MNVNTESAPIGCDYRLSVADAVTLRAIALMPADMRIEMLREFVMRHGVRALTELFAEFIGLANSVVANNREMIELILIQESVCHPDRVDVNLPTIGGALAGIEPATLCITESTCGGCAYKLGTVANQCPPTAQDALEATDGEHQFWCHEDVNDDGSVKHLCRGHAAVMKLKRETIGGAA